MNAGGTGHCGDVGTVIHNEGDSLGLERGGELLRDFQHFTGGSMFMAILHKADACGGKLLRTIDCRYG